MCTPEDEPLILQQFLRFSVTRPLTQQLILQELCEKNADTKAKLQEHMMKLMSNNNTKTNNSDNNSNNSGSVKAAVSPGSASGGQAPMSPPGGSSSVSPARSHSQPSPASSQCRTSPESVSSHPQQQPVPTSSSQQQQQQPSSNGSLPSPVATSSSASSTVSLTSPSPLNKLQSMHPFDYRQKHEHTTPDSQVSRSPVEKPVPASMAPMRFPHGPAPPGMPPGYPIPPSFGMGQFPGPGGLSPYQHQLAAARFHDARARGQTEDRKPQHKEDNLFPPSFSRSLDTKPHSRPEQEPRQGPGRRPLESARQLDLMFDDLGTSFVNPTTGKKRVQCNVCLKTFCDKGALKIHFSAVHLREMHKCSVPGCNMMFSSRRSRNRHSANPNPKLHTPHIRRKISPHDGRTHQGPVLPFEHLHRKNQGCGGHHGGHHGCLPHPLGHPGLPVPGVTPPFPPFPNIPPHLMPPELQKIHHHQMELQRIQEMQKLSSLYSRRLAESGGLHHKKEDGSRLRTEAEKDRDHSIVGSEAGKSESETDTDQKADITDDDKSVDNQSGKDEVSSAGRKRKSQNPIRITQGEAVRGEDVNYSSDDNDEGFPDPMDDFDEDDETLMDYDSTDDADDQIRLAKERKMNNHSGGKNGDGEMTESGKLRNDPDDKQADHQSGADGKENMPEPGEEEKSEGGTAGKIHVRSDLTVGEKFTSGANNNNNSEAEEEMMEAEVDEEADIPIDKENPLRCVDCGEEFPNHFAVKLHYQNVHLKLMHNCTVDGCNAAFPSKRSRDRHSSNHTLHRKLLSTSSDTEAGPEGEVTKEPEARDRDLMAPVTPRSSLAQAPSGPGHAAPPPYQNEFLARFLAEQQQRLAFPFGLPGPGPISSSSHGAGHLNSLANINNSGACKPGQGPGLLPPPFGMFPFNPLLGDMSQRLPGLLHKGPGLLGQEHGQGHHHGHQAPSKMMEENLRKYMAMAGLVNKVENH